MNNKEVCAVQLFDNDIVSNTKVCLIEELD